jgi:hypothetical protein
MFSWIGKFFRTLFNLFNWILIFGLAAAIGALVYFSYQSSQNN